MLNDMKSELYQIRRSRTFLGAAAVMAGLLAAIIALLKYVSLHFNSGDVDALPLSPIFTSISAIFAVVLIMAGLLESNDHLKQHTLKNTVAFGIPRREIYLGKFLSQLLACTVLYIGLAAFYMAVGSLVLGLPAAEEVTAFWRALAGGYPLCVCCLSVSFCFFVNMGSGWGGVLSAAGILYFLPKVFYYLGFKFPFFSLLYKWAPSNMVGSQMDGAGRFYFWDTASGMAHCYLTGVVGILLFIGIGMYWLEKREVR